ncbi:hypothetical protein Pyn_34775 [Prunus yedoensis var. nudiflora]|uniref:Uncharacterized protein n=1 Tax=Prunus yedoensis var. nudiflora TaxID=2094558 RepID=A0A314ZDI2_PRUYE|nr:hypothetical protein Pyn_34775 [Prunus yedoensis var. nudiflora]
MGRGRMDSKGWTPCIPLEVIDNWGTKCTGQSAHFMLQACRVDHHCPGLTQGVALPRQMKRRSLSFRHIIVLLIRASHHFALPIKRRPPVWPGPDGSPSPAVHQPPFVLGSRHEPKPRCGQGSLSSPEEDNPLVRPRRNCNAIDEDGRTRYDDSNLAVFIRLSAPAAYHVQSDGRLPGPE